MRLARGPIDDRKIRCKVEAVQFGYAVYLPVKNNRKYKSGIVCETVCDKSRQQKWDHTSAGPSKHDKLPNSRQSGSFITHEMPKE